MPERYQLFDTFQLALQQALANLHTATVARVTSVGSTTINCRPVINRVVRGESIELPEFVDVPPVFMQGGGSYTAHPIAPGDYCLLIFTERCFDRWYDGRDFQPPAEFRMHDYSDGFALVGVNTRDGAITIPSVITHIGDAYQEGNYEHQGDRDQTGDYVQEGDYTQTGNLTREGTSEQTGDETVIGNSTVTGTMAAGQFSGTNGGAMQSDVPIETTDNVEAATYSVGGTPGASGTFTSQDGKTITVTNGLVTGIS